MKKRDMYIDYNRYYKRRGRRRGNKAIKVAGIILAVAAVGFGIFYSIKVQIDSSPEMKYVQKPKEETKELGQASINSDTTEQTEVGPNTAEQTVASPDTVEQTDAGQDTNTTSNQNTSNSEGSEEAEQEGRVPVKVKGIYVTGNAAGADYRYQLIELADTTEINTMVIDVKNDEGRITYSMDSGMAKEIGATTNTISNMEGLIAELKEKNIYVIARIVAFKDPYLAEKRKDLAILNKDGSYYTDNNGDYWVNPYKKEVWDYLLEVASQAAALGFQEIQFDYIRFSTGGTIKKVDYGKDALSKTKEQAIIDFTKYVYEKLKPQGVFVSADVYGTIISSSVDASLVGQNYMEMAKYLDYICPMIYPSHFGEGNYGIEYPDLEPFNIIRKVLTASKAKLEQIPEGEHCAIVRPWLQDFTATWLKKHKKYGGAELKEQIRGVNEAGYEEWLLWNASCKYSADGLEEE